MSVDRLSRRRALSGLSTVGAVAVVGCLGGGTQLTLGVGPAGTRSYQAAHALAVAADRHSERLSVRIESVGTPSERLYSLAEGELTAAGVDNTTLYRASENHGVFDLDPIEPLPHQGFAYGYRELYWIAPASAAPDSTAALTSDQVVHPGQPGTPSRLVTEQLLRDARLWDTVAIDNRPHAELPTAVDEGTVDCLVAVQHSHQTLADWSAAVDEAVGDQLAAVSFGPSFQSALDDAPNALAREIEPVGWTATTLTEPVDGWAVPMQWLWSPSADSDAVAELTRLAHDHYETLGEIDPLALGGEPEQLADSVVDGLTVHEGAAEAFGDLGSQNSDWTVGDAVD